MKKWIVERLKKIYINLIKIRATRKKKNQKIVFLLSFPTTSYLVLAGLYEVFKTDVVICYTKEAEELAQKYQQKGCSIYRIDNVLSLLKSVVPITKGSRVVLCDNYFAFLAGINFYKETRVVQLWHANGAIKLFGLEANYAKESSISDQQRYLSVYRKYTDYVVSSNKMRTIFETNYQQKINQLPFAYPLTDIYFNQEWINESKRKLMKFFDSSKKILLYVPTYREDEADLPLDFGELARSIGNEWQIVVKAHPHDRLLQNKLVHEKTIISEFQGLDIQQLLLVADVLVTDYSSLPFEYTLARPDGNIIFFCYDLAKYKRDVGIEYDFEQWAPGPIVQNQDELLHVLKKMPENDFTSFNEVWNEYVDGTSIDQLIEWVRNQYEK